MTRDLRVAIIAYRLHACCSFVDLVPKVVILEI